MAKRRYFRFLFHILTVTALPALVVAWGCSSSDPGDPVPQHKGTVRVNVATGGTNTDPDGYTVTVSPVGFSQDVGLDDTVYFTGVPTGDVQVTLSGLASACAPDNGPLVRSVTVTANDTVAVTYHVTCTGIPPASGIDVEIITTGTNPDDSYTVVLDGDVSEVVTVGASLPDTATVGFTNVAVGQHKIEITGVVSNCTVGGTNPRDVDVTAGGAAKVSFHIGCSGGPVPNDIVFVSGDPVSTVSNIWVMNADGTGITQLTYAADPQWLPRFSPDGARIAYYQERLDAYGTPAGDVWVMDADGTNATNLTIGLDGFVGAGAEWSPDAKQLVVLGYEQDGPWNQFILDLETMTLSVGLVANTAAVPVMGLGNWSPDGMWIVFDDLSHGIWRVETGGGTAVKLIDPSPHALTEPIWSPDGSQIVMQRNLFGIWLMDADGGNARELIAEDAAPGGYSPTWLPDGRVGFSPYVGLGLYIVNTDGTGLTNIAGDSGMAMGHPDWNPAQ